METIKPGLKTSEGRLTLIAILVPILMPVVKAIFGKFGLHLDVDASTVSTALLANAGVTGAYAAGRSYVKATAMKVLE
ncbi:MAG: hypothetical protein KIT79_15400 [Deltaproteobacteria bacterium]|nr:hypothetical protein [Deltaproteobacteria bacterium]